MKLKINRIEFVLLAIVISNGSVYASDKHEKSDKQKGKNKQ